MKRIKIWPFLCFPLLLLCSGLLGALLGKGLAETKNTINTENFTEFSFALPTQLLDINGELITEYSSDEKREMTSFNDLPQQVVDALLTREDRIFYDHPGFSTKAILRAVVGVLTRTSLGGGSTLTQQIAGTLYCDRTDMSVGRKLKELWWAIQMERRFSKNEILELYLNKIYFGGGTNGVNAACKYYFKHSAEEITPAEASILVIQLSNPSYYNPFDHPDRAMSMQQVVLDAMVELGYVTKDEAEESFDDYWANFDYNRTSTSSYEMRVDNAPWFSEYVRRELNDMFYGTEDIYTSGYTVYTTLNLAHQRAAEEIMHDYIAYANSKYQKSMSESKKATAREFVPIVELMCLTFNLPSMKISEQRTESLSYDEYATTVNPVLDILSMITGIESLKTQIIPEGNNLLKKNTERTTIEGTMIAIENGTGYIDAIVGGSKYDASNQYIRAVQSKLQPGSTFKPLYYSAAIDSRQFTMSTVISDTPVVFHKDDGSPYLPQDFLGKYEGDVELWYALAHSMNIPSLKVLDGVGFDAAINRATSLTGIPVDEWDSRGIQAVYPLGLGVCSVRPVEMAQAFATFANNGKQIPTLCIRYIEDKDGNIIKNPEQEQHDYLDALGSEAQIISPQNAFIMQEMLKKTVQSGTLVNGSNFDSTLRTIKKNKGVGNKFLFKNSDGRSFYMPAAGKTGTTQNWADAWTVGFTPYYTAAFWFGFDRPGQSLGLELTGSTLAGVAWGDFMNVANKGKPYKPFVNKIPNGIVALKVCDETGLLYTDACGEHDIVCYYLAGTEPTETCELHIYNYAEELGLDHLRMQQILSGYKYEQVDDTDLFLDLSFLDSEDGKSNTQTLFDDIFSDSGDSFSFDSLNLDSFDDNYYMDDETQKTDTSDYLNEEFNKLELNARENNADSENGEGRSESGIDWLTDPATGP